MKLKKLSVILPLFVLLFLPIVVSGQFTTGDSINISSCMDFTTDIAVIDNSLFAWGGTLGADEKIALIDISNPLAMTLETCLDLGDIGSTLTINVIESFTSGIDYFLLAAFQSGGGDGLTIVNVTGTTLIEDITYAVPSGAFEFRHGTMLEIDDVVYVGCDVANAKVYEVFNEQGSQSIIERNSGLGGGLCYGITNAFGNPSNPVFAIVIKEDRTALMLFSSGEEIDNTTYTTGATQATDCIEQKDDIVILACNGFSVLNVTGNAFIEGDATNMGGGVQTMGLAFTSTDTVILVGRNATNDEGNLYAYNISDKSNVERLDLLLNFTRMTSTGSVEYVFPYTYVSSNRFLIYSIGFIPPELNSTNNIKPKITAIDAPALAGIGENKIFTYNVVNPETATGGQKIVTGISCDYTETLALNDNFNIAPNNCGITNIGVIKGFDYGTALNISNCTGLHLLSSNNTITDNTIISFDLKMSEDSETSIDVIDVGFSVITTLDFTVNNSLLSVSSQGTIILDNINISSASTGSIPTRFYILLKPGENNDLHMATNYRLFNTELDKVFCDDTEFCYIGNEPFASLSDFTNVYGLIVNGGVTTVGDVLIDNLKIVGVDTPPILIQITDLELAFICTYNRTGTINTRIYASDTTTGTNYLYYESIDILVRIIIPEIGSGNMSLTDILEDAVAISGFKDSDDLELLALMVIIGTIAGIGLLFLKVSDGNAAVSVSIALIVGMLLTVFFWRIEWLSTSYLVIVVLIVAALLGALLTKMFAGYN